MCIVNRKHAMFWDCCVHSCVHCSLKDWYTHTHAHRHRFYLIGCILSHLLCQSGCLCSYPRYTSPFCALICTPHHCLMMDDGTSALTGGLGKFVFSQTCFFASSFIQYSLSTSRHNYSSAFSCDECAYVPGLGFLDRLSTSFGLGETANRIRVKSDKLLCDVNSSSFSQVSVFFFFIWFWRLLLLYASISWFIGNRRQIEPANTFRLISPHNEIIWNAYVGGCEWHFTCA